jgi:hypothetical protein
MQKRASTALKRFCVKLLVVAVTIQAFSLSVSLQGSAKVRGCFGAQSSSTVWVGPMIGTPTGWNIPFKQLSVGLPMGLSIREDE